MFLTIKKFRARINELKALRYKDINQINNWKIKEDITKNEKYPPLTDDGFKQFYLGDVWGGRDNYFWIKTTVSIPHSNEEVLLLLDLGKTGAGYNSGFESLLFINQEPYQGVDQNHKEVFIDPCYNGKTINIALKLWTGLEGGGVRKVLSHVFKRGDLVTLDNATDQLYYLSDAICKTLEQLLDNNPEKHVLTNLLQKSFKLIDWSDPKSQSFYKTINQAYKFLEKELLQTNKKSLINFTGIGHTHIDLAWLWQYKHTQEKAARSFSTVLRLMEKYPDYIFLQTQPQIYEFIANEYPEIYKKIKQKISEGRWEVDGAMWVEADCNIPSGESLVRQILLGTLYINKEFNQDVNYLWLPDVFGYSWALPQILKKSNINTFMTTKISWNQYNRMPHDTFWWSGIDGSKILTHFITTPEIDHDDHTDWFYTYNGHVEPETLLGSYEGYRDKNINQEILLAYGYGDGGGGVTRDMLEKIRILDKIPALPNIKTGTVKEYFKKLHGNIANSKEYVHTWDGELYLEYHRGTYTSQAYVKKCNRKIELALRNLEILYFMNHAKSNYPYPKHELNHIWKLLLKNQFHDVIPGSSIKEVYEDYRNDAKQMINSLTTLFYNLTNQTDKVWTIVNTCGWQRSSYVKIVTNKIGKFYLDDKKLNRVKLHDGYLIEMHDVKPLESQTIIMKDEEVIREDELPTPTLTNKLETQYYLITWNHDGQIISLYDRLVQREVVKKGGVINKLVVYEDKPLAFNAWDIDIFYQEKYQVLKANKIELIEDNIFYYNVCFSYRFGKSQIDQNMKVYKHKRRIDFITNVIWHEQQRLLRALFNVEIRNTEATYDIQYGNVKRPTHWNTSWDMAKFETVAHQWIDLSEKNYGVSLMNDCKYGHSVKDSTMGITLLKGAIDPDPDADQGEHNFTYSIMPHQYDFLQGETVKEAWDLNDQLLVIPGNFNVKNLFVINDEDVWIDAIKQAEDERGWIIRIHDHTGGTRNINIKLNFEIDKWCEVNLIEEKCGEYCLSNDIYTTLKPYEIKTFKIYFKDHN